MRKGSTIAAIVSSIFPTVLFILLGLKADCIAVYFIGCIAFSIIDFIIPNRSHNSTDTCHTNPTGPGTDDFSTLSYFLILY